MSQKRLLYVISNLGIGGAEKMLFEVISRLDRRRFLPRVVNLRGRQEYVSRLESLGIRVDLLGAGDRPALRTLTELTGIIRGFQPDLIHAWLYKSIQLARLGKLFAGNPPVISSPRTNYRIFTRAFLAIDRWLKGLDRLVIAESQATADFLVEGQRYDRHKVRVIRNGVDLTRFKFSQESRAKKRMELGLRLGLDPQEAHQTVIGLAAGRIDRNKGYHLLLAALRELEAGGVRDLKIVLAGTGPEREALAQQCSEFGLGDRFIWLGQRDDVPELLSAADLFIHPSLVEGLPNAILEASAASLPVVAAAADGTREVVIDGQTGILVPPGEVTPLASAIAALAGDPDRRREIGRQGREFMEANFDIDLVARRYQDAYLQTLGETGGQASQ